jgi:hypothetical protein
MMAYIKKKTDGTTSTPVRGGDNYYRAFLMVEQDKGTGDVYVMFHKTVIVYVRHRTGQVTLNSGGYQTLTTRLSMLDALRSLRVTIDAQWTTVYTPSGRIAYKDPVTFPVAASGSSSSSSVSDEVFAGLRQLGVREGTRADLRKKEASYAAASPVNRSKVLAAKEREKSPAYPLQCDLRQSPEAEAVMVASSSRPASSLVLHDVFEFPPLRQISAAEEIVATGKETPKNESVGHVGQNTPTPPHHLPVNLADEDDLSILCCMCMESETSVILMPCSHGCLCAECTQTIMTCQGNPCQGLCPVCKFPIEDYIDILD